MVGTALKQISSSFNLLGFCLLLSEFCLPLTYWSFCLLLAYRVLPSPNLSELCFLLTYWSFSFSKSTKLRDLKKGDKKCIAHLQALCPWILMMICTGLLQNNNMMIYISL